MSGVTGVTKDAGKPDSKVPKPRAKSSAYACFSKSLKEDFLKSNPGEKMNMLEWSKKCSEQWKLVSESDKSEFKKQAECDKRRFDNEMEIYAPGEQKMKKRSKDPNAPKKPLTAFIIFSQEKRSEVKEKNPSMTMPDIARHLGALWKEISAEERKPFDAKAAENKNKYSEMLAEYSKSKNASEDEDKENAGKEDKENIQVRRGKQNDSGKTNAC